MGTPANSPIFPFQNIVSRRSGGLLMLQDLFSGVLQDLAGGARGILTVIGVAALLALGSTYLVFDAHPVMFGTAAHAGANQGQPLQR